uniref:Palmitoyltransferase n=1 Tax=Panagrolaimus sp. JU765 TaxID=591449 RepID=A0AC34R0L2_9BILA
MELKDVIRNFGGDSTQAVDMLRRFANEKALPVRTCDYRTGFVRYCHKCYAVKPDRASHCSVCDQCVLKYDHHCIWVNNCVSFCNYKYFVLFLFYGFLLCLYGFATMLPSFIELVSHRSRRQGEIQLILVFFFAGMFGISLAALLFFHIYLLATNQSTVEFARPPILDCGPFKRAYDLGLKKNFLQVFGHQCWKWPLPVSSSHGTGFEFPLSVNCYTMVYSEDAETGGQRVYTMSQSTTTTSQNRTS